MTCFRRKTKETTSEQLGGGIDHIKITKQIGGNATADATYLSSQLFTLSFELR